MPPFSQSSTEHRASSRRTPARGAGRPTTWVGRRSQRRRRRVRDAADEIARGKVQLLLCASQFHACQQNLSDPSRLSCTKQPIIQLTRQPTSPSHLPVKQDNPLNPDFPGLSNARHDAALDCAVSPLPWDWGGECRRGPGPGGLVGQGLADCWRLRGLHGGRRGACVVEVVEV